MATSSVIRTKVGKRIQKRRNELGLTQEDLAHKVDISRTHMGHIEQGSKSPSIEVLEKLAKALKIPLSQLF